MTANDTWDLDALWNAAGRATLAHAWRAPDLDSDAGPGYWRISTSVNMWGGNFIALYGRGPADAEGMQASLTCALDHGLETAAFVHPRIYPQVLPVIENRSVIRGGPLPLMVRRGLPGADLRRMWSGTIQHLPPGSDPSDAVTIVSDAFHMNPSLVMQALGGAVDHPEISLHLAGITEPTAVCISHVHDDACYIDIMAVSKAAQRQGSGRAVLLAAMDDAASRGVDRFFLFASEAGQPLYQSLGYEVIDVAQFWLLNPLEPAEPSTPTA